MKVVAYLIALQQPNDLKYIAKHASKVETYLKKTGAEEIQFGALVLADRGKERKNIFCIGDNREDSLLFYNYKQFKKHLNGFSYVPIEGVDEESLYDAFSVLKDHEFNRGNSELNKDYHIFIVDFREESSVFIGIEADIIADVYANRFTGDSSFCIIRQLENKDAYSRLVDLLSEKITELTFSGRGDRDPLSFRAFERIIK